MHELAKVRGGEGCMKIQRKSGRREWQGWKARNVIRCFLPRRKFEGQELKTKMEMLNNFIIFLEKERENAHVFSFYLRQIVFFCFCFLMDVLEQDLVMDSKPMNNFIVGSF